ncbi:hypothetical protein WT83_27490 [Burkholderia territorii]|uniref:Pilus assembly protein n=1 Tax=Burkholderia territorii TaxID=1503055 RepID=A0A108E835_9BURK|nr:hypothetical protein [Burkholderia territorii]KWN06428.1 hypothetical protein WT83_27490 [Burkholderia territorii]
MSTLSTRRSRAVEYTVIGCVAVGVLFGMVHLVRRDYATQNRADAIAAGCRPVVVAQASRLAQERPGLKWSIDRIDVLGEIVPDQPDQNTCAVTMTFDVGGHVDKELWGVGAVAGLFQLGSAKLSGVETEH